MASRFKHSARLWNKLMHVQMNFKKAKKLAKIKPLERWTIREGDLVELLVGRDRGRQAVVQAVNKERNSVVLEGLKMTKRFVSATENQTGGIVLKESLVHVSNVNLVDPETNRRTRVRMVKNEGEWMRISARSGMVIPWPEIALPEKKTNTLTDTASESVMEETYVPFDYMGMTEQAPFAAADPKVDPSRPPNWTQSKSKYSHITDFQVLGSRFIRDPASQVEVDEGAEI